MLYIIIVIFESVIFKSIKNNINLLIVHIDSPGVESEVDGARPPLRLKKFHLNFFINFMKF